MICPSFELPTLFAEGFIFRQMNEIAEVNDYPVWSTHDVGMINKFSQSLLKKTNLIQVESSDWEEAFASS